MSLEVEAAPQWLDKAGSYRTDCTLLMNRPAAMRAAQMDSRLKTLTLTHRNKTGDQSPRTEAMPRWKKISY